MCWSRLYCSAKALRYAITCARQQLGQWSTGDVGSDSVPMKAWVQGQGPNMISADPSGGGDLVHVQITNEEVPVKELSEHCFFGRSAI